MQGQWEQPLNDPPWGKKKKSCAHRLGNTPGRKLEGETALLDSPVHLLWFPGSSCIRAPSFLQRDALFPQVKVSRKDRDCETEGSRGQQVLHQ